MSLEHARPACAARPRTARSPATTNLTSPRKSWPIAGAARPPPSPGIMQRWGLRPLKVAGRNLHPMRRSAPPKSASCTAETGGVAGRRGGVAAARLEGNRSCRERATSNTPAPISATASKEVRDASYRSKPLPPKARVIRAWAPASVELTRSPPDPSDWQPAREPVWDWRRHRFPCARGTECQP